MKRNSGSFGIMVLGSVLYAIAVQPAAGAAEAPAPQVKSIAPATAFVHPAAALAADSIHEVRAAVRIVSQAALQRDFASNGRIRALLQSAHDMLAASEQSLCCAALDEVVQFEGDIKQMVDRVDNVSDAWQNRYGVTIRPPNRDELNVLAKEGQNLLRKPIAQAGAGYAAAFATARNAASLALPPVEQDVVGRRHRAWPASPGTPQANTLLSFNF